jgi:hypothetical protein
LWRGDLVEDEAQRRENPASHFNFLYHVIFLGLGLGVVEGKIRGEDYRKRSRLMECAKEKRSVEGAGR